MLLEEQDYCLEIQEQNPDWTESPGRMNGIRKRECWLALLSVVMRSENV